MKSIDPECSNTASTRPTDSQTTRALLKLRELLLSGQFRPGERLSEVPLTALLNVSRTPLRLALTTLEHEGLLEMHPTRGFVVRAFTLSDVYEAIEIRGVLEGTAARFAAERLPRDAQTALQLLTPINEVVALLDRVIEAPAETVGLFEQYVGFNERFHKLLLDLARSEVLTREMERIVSLPFASPNGFLLIQGELPGWKQTLTIAQDQHREIVAAIAFREGTRAESLAREHARIARRLLDLALQDKKLYDLVPGSSLIRNCETKGAAAPSCSSAAWLRS
jgi:GntR family transcriptional regulator of vanillate catabolism